MGKKKVEEVKNNKRDSKETGKDSDNKKEIKNSKEKDTSKVKNKSSENKRRTKTDDYYDELTKENKIVDIIKEKEEKIKEEQKPQDNKSATKKKVTKSDMIFLNIQFFLSIITIVLVIVYFFNKSLMFALQISLGLTMIVTGVNNIKVYKRKALTVFYFILGIALLVLAVITMLGK